MKKGIVRVCELQETPETTQLALEHSDHQYEFDIPEGATEDTIQLLAYGTLFKNDWAMQDTTSEWYITQ